MILSNNGENFQYGGITYTIGEQVAANDQSGYEGLVGKIVEIRDGNDKETENDTPDIYCQFDIPVLPDDIIELEKRFSKLYGKEKTIEDITFDYVVMSPEMIFSTSGRYTDKKQITVYSVSEKWANNGEYGSSTDLYTSHSEAIREFKLRLGIEANDGIIADLSCISNFTEEFGNESYECYIDGRHCECHFIISVEKKILSLSDSFLEIIADMKIDEARIADFINQISQWDALEKLTDKEYQALISNPEIADSIQNALSKNDSFSSAYWESISEVAHRMVENAVSKSSKGDDCHTNSENLSS